MVNVTTAFFGLRELCRQFVQWTIVPTFEALVGTNPAILDCFDCEQTLYQLSNTIQAMSTPTASNPRVISFRLQ